MTMRDDSRHYGDELPLYVAGHVSPEKRAAIDRHLAECATCRHECDLWRSLPAALASLHPLSSPDLTNNEVWSKLAPHLQDTSIANGRTTIMSISDFPPQPSLEAKPVRVPRAVRRNTWAAVAVVLVVIVLMGGFFAVLKGRNTSPSVGGKRPVTATATVSPNLVTKSDAEALFGGFLPACADPATYTIAGPGVPCAKLDRGRIYDVGAHFCVDDWHLVSSQLVDTKSNLQNYKPQQSIDGVILQTTRTPIRLIDPAYSQQHYGGQFYYIQIGVVVSPQRISVGSHSLRQFMPGTSFDRQIPFTIDASGTGVCRKA